MRQRHLIMRGIGARQDNLRRAIRTARIAAAAALAFVLGGAVMYESVKPALIPAPVPVRRATLHPMPKSEDQVSRDPWESEELKDFHSVVQWESWVDNNNGDQL